jgi:hypothetical protein
MFKTRLRQWSFSKNISSSEWHAVAKLYKTRRDCGKHITEFLVSGRRKTIADLQKHIKLLNVSEGDFFAAADSVVVPPHVRCCTPDPGGTRASSSRSPAPSPSTRSTSSNLHFTPINSHTLLSHPPSSSMGNSPLQQDTKSTSLRGSAMEAAVEQELEHNEDFVWVSDTSKQTPEVLSSSSSCDQVQQDVRTMALQAAQPVALTSRHGAEDIESWVLVTSNGARGDSQASGHLCSKCQQPLSKHGISLETFTPSTRQLRNSLPDAPRNDLTLPSTTEHHGEAWRWMAFCFAACICMSRGELEVAARCLSGAASEFEDLLLKKDHLTLLSLNLMLPILHMHDQGSIAKSIVQTVREVAERVLSVDDPVRTTIEWMVTVAGRTLKKSGHNEEAMIRLGEAHQNLETELGVTSPTTIASLYNVAWMLCYEGRWEEAEEKLHILYESSSTTLGTTHMQSVMILSTLSRAQSSQGNHAAGIRTIRKAICDSESTLGRSHPYRLELKRRLALMYKDIGEKELMESLYWDVLKGRIKMLGAQHPYTAGAREDLESLLKELGRWNEDGSTQWSIDELFVTTSSTSEHEAY